MFIYLDLRESFNKEKKRYSKTQAKKDMTVIERLSEFWSEPREQLFWGLEGYLCKTILLVRIIYLISKNICHSK